VRVSALEVEAAKQEGLLLQVLELGMRQTDALGMLRHAFHKAKLELAASRKCASAAAGGLCTGVCCV
jgi:hypothetical protein